MTALPSSAKSFAFANVTGLSRGALDLHLSLYHGYVKQVAILQEHCDAISTEDAFDEVVKLRMAGLVQRMAFELNGLHLHELFFEQLDGQPADQGSSPTGPLLQAMNMSFVSTASWRNQVTRLAQTRGIGWVVTSLDLQRNVLRNFWVAEHHLGVSIDHHVIAVFDLWEHAYLPDHMTGNREDYMTTLFRNLDWSVLERRMRAYA